MHSPGPLPSRRAVLGGALAGLATPALAACAGSPLRPGPPEVARDVVAADRAATRERQLVAAYDAALALAPELAERLLPLRADHEQHLVALGLPDPAPVDPGADVTASPAPTPDPVATPRLPAEPTALLAALGALERRAATAHTTAAVLSGRGTGAVLAALAASEASHVVALT